MIINPAASHAIGEGIFLAQVLVLLVSVIFCLLGASDKLRGWPAARQYRMRDLLTVLIFITTLGSLAFGMYGLTAICFFIVMPATRAALDPTRSEITEARQAEIAAAMTRSDALRLLELEPDEAVAPAIEIAYDRLHGLVSRRKGGGSPFYLARLQAARDFLLK